MGKKRNTYSREFKCEAVKQLQDGKKSGADLARELGVQRNMLYKWQRELAVKGNEAFQGPGRKACKQDREAVLERENRRLKKENDILRKAAAFFARELS